MGRWRPPAETSTALITPQGQARLKAELDDLWRVRRPEVVKALTAAAAEGDRSENAEYTYRKKQLGEIDRRVRYLARRLQALRVVDTAPSDRDAVYFGAEIELEDTRTGDRVRHRIVGPDETDAGRGWFSIDSPLARALLKKRVGDTVEVALPAGARTLMLAGIAYPSFVDD